MRRAWSGQRKLASEKHPVIFFETGCTALARALAEEHGKVVRTFAVNEGQSLSISDGKSATQDDVTQSYRRLVEPYRESFFGNFDKAFTTRYLN